MEDYPHLAEATISNESALATGGLIEKVKYKVLETTKAITMEDKEEGDSEAKDPEHFEVNKMVQPFGNLFQVIKKKGEQVKDYYKEDVNELVSNLKHDASSTINTLNQGINNLSLSIGKNLIHSEEKEREEDAPKETTTSSFFSTFTSLAKNSGLTEYAQKISKDTGLGEYAEKISKSTGLGEYAEKISEGVSTFIKQAIVIEAPEEIEAQETKSILDRKFAKLLKLRTNVVTYIEDPNTTEHKEAYEKFIEGFKLEDYQKENESLLKENPEMLRNFDRLVPSVIDAITFWTRYHFNVLLLEQEEQKRNQLLKESMNKDVELFNWDESESEGEIETRSETKDKTPEENTVENEQKDTLNPESKANKAEESYEIVEGTEKSESLESEVKKEDKGDEKSDDDDWASWE